jgi:Leucine-rich repeat (LRR) protein
LTDVDLHGNALRTLPSTMGNLSMLTTLNLSRNQLGNECLETIGRIKSLKELRLAENKLADVLPDSVSWLEDLIILDLQKNSITELPSSLGRLSKLSKLNVSTNRLSSIPFEAIFDLNITEIVASRNQLDGYLLPSSVPSIRSLKALDISTNRLLGIAETAIELPALITLEMANNRVSELPSVASWLNLITLNAEENKLSAFPEGFTKLHNLQSADFGNNSLLSIDDGIGDMVGLASLNIKNNPIKERRLPRLTTHELKAELRSRRPLIQDSPTENGASSEGSPLSYWPVRDGVLDRSNTRLQSIDKTELEPLTRHNVNSMLLHHNQLPKISPAIELLGETLVSLDLSYNKLGKTDMYLTECLTLPNLHTLNLTSNALISLDPLVNRLTAPKLETLIFSFNRIKTLPALCEAFPALSKLIASNNAIGVLDVDSVRGLRVLDVSSNEIESLPPRLAVLQGQLRTLVVTGNRFRVPGYAILQKGTEEVLKWLRMKIPAGEEGAIRPEMEKQ